MRYLLSTVLALVVPVLTAQDHTASGLFHRFMERVSVRTTAGSYAGQGDYGVLGTGAVDFRVATLAPFSRSGFFFTGDASVFAGAGVGSRYKTGDLARPLNMKTYFVGVSLPVVNFSGLLGMSHPFGIQIDPFYENALTRNYQTGNHSGVNGFGLSASLNWFATEYLGFSAHVSRFKGRQPKGGFVWDTITETVGIGMTLNVGRLLEGSREVRSDYARLVGSHASLRESFQGIKAERDSLLREQTAVRDSLLLAAVHLARLAELRTQDESVSPPRPVIVRASEPTENHDEYDGERKAPVRVIRIDKQLFHGSDLVEEDYLKAILSIVSKHSSYVWEVAYRDFGSSGHNERRVLADKIRQFFQIYDSRLRRRIVLTHDGSMRPEFEIRCLGLAKQDISDAVEE